MNATQTIETPADCLHCGVCCFSTLDTFVRVEGADWARLGDDAERVAHFLGNRAFMRMRDGHCAALELRGAPDGDGASGGVRGARTEYFCTVYEKRPRICRELERGSPECMGELAAKAGRASEAGWRTDDTPFARKA